MCSTKALMPSGVSMNSVVILREELDIVADINLVQIQISSNLQKRRTSDGEAYLMKWHPGMK